ncbi:hypothetical protein BgiBS90_030718, partial [Biomphalaria glabrata]
VLLLEYNDYTRTRNADISRVICQSQKATNNCKACRRSQYRVNFVGSEQSVDCAGDLCRL